MRFAVRRFDALLRQAFGVFEFTDRAEGLLRLQWGQAPRRFCLSDGTCASRHDAILMLHIWNEHIPAMGPGGPDFLWARKLLRQLTVSMQDLAAWLCHEPRCADINILCGDTVLIPLFGASRGQRLLLHLGFDLVPVPVSPWGRFGEFWENLYTWALMWAYNPASLRRKRLVELRRAWLCISRQRLLDLYGLDTTNSAPAKFSRALM